MNTGKFKRFVYFVIKVLMRSYCNKTFGNRTHLFVCLSYTDRDVEFDVISQHHGRYRESVPAKQDLESPDSFGKQLNILTVLVSS